MKTTIHHPTYGFITYDESAWTGKKIITIGGAPLLKVKKNIFQYIPVAADPFANVEESADGAVAPAPVTVVVKGSFVGGVSLVIGEEIIPLTAKASALDIILSVIPAVLFFFFILGGAIGGAVSALIGIGLTMLMKTRKKAIHKILICLGLSAAVLAVGIPLLLVMIAAQV